MATFPSLFNAFRFRFLFLVAFLCVGCFFFPSQDLNSNPQPPRKRRKISPLSSSPPTGASSLQPTNRSSSIRSYIASLFTFRKSTREDQSQSQNPGTTATPSIPPPSPDPQPLALSPDGTPSLFVEKGNPFKRPSFTSRTDIYPCPACGEVLLKPHLLDLHHASKHSLSELSTTDSGKNIIEMIFQSGWRGKPPTIDRVLKINNTSKTLGRFEEYRETVRSRAARQRRGGGDERCIADGNERLRFYCSTVLCALGREGRAMVGACGSQFCSTCGIVRHGFSGKHAELEGIATYSTSWGAHVSLPEDLEEEFSFLRVRRAVLVCRVVAGRVAYGGMEEDEEEGKVIYDSVVAVGRGGGVRSSLGGEEELLVINPRALLPCFVIIYAA